MPARLDGQPNKRQFTPEQRFWKKVRKTSGCWLWLGFKNNYGYGQFWLNGRMAKAHRYSYETNNGPLPNGLLALHHCDNPGCVRPAHLFAGTQSDNTRDCIQKGRFRPKGMPMLRFRKQTEKAFQPSKTDK